MPQDKVTFAHLSDIHFIKGISGESRFDLDAAVRSALLDDARRFQSKLSPVLGVLVTGDIAFAGQSDEYDTAITWLNQLCRNLDCDEGAVWCIPGNHDVDRSVLKEFTAIPALHEQLRRSSDLDSKLREHLENDNTGPTLFAPLRSYNEKIGQRFDSFTRPKQPWWVDEVELNDKSKLRIRGLNSVIVSGPDDDDRDHKLLLGSAQTEYGREGGIEYLSLCHHPIDWLLDGENTQEALLAYSRIQLFGHKHVQRVTQMDNTLWLSAGAVHPVRTEKQWLPRYNYLSISVEGTGNDRHMSVDVYARAWSQTERLFTREQSSGNADLKTYRLRLPEWTLAMAGKEEVSSGQGNTQDSAQEPDRTRLTMSRKRLLYRFIGLPHHSRIAIMKKFGLLEPEDSSRPDPEVFAACFDRARTKGVLDDVWNAIEAEKT